MSSVETTVSHIGAPPPAGDNSEKFGVSPTPRVDTKVDTKVDPKVANVGTGVSKVAADQLRSVVGRIERLEEEKKGLADDIRGIYVEAKGNGYDVKALRTIVRLRKMKEGDRTEQEAILDRYKHALGMMV